MREMRERPRSAGAASRFETARQRRARRAMVSDYSAACGRGDARLRPRRRADGATQGIGRSVRSQVK